MCCYVSFLKTFFFIQTNLIWTNYIFIYCKKLKFVLKQKIGLIGRCLNTRWIFNINYFDTVRRWIPYQWYLDANISSYHNISNPINARRLTIKCVILKSAYILLSVEIKSYFRLEDIRYLGWKRDWFFNDLNHF